MDNDSFTLTFSTAELLCAATALGIVALPVKGHTQLTGEAMQVEIYKGYESLQKRQLIHSLSPVKWQVDNLLVTLAHWLATPDYLLQMDMWQNNGERWRENVYFWQTQAVWLQSIADQHQFTFFNSRDNWLRRALDWMGPMVKPTEDYSLPLPQLNLAAFLARVQQNQAETDSLSIMRRAGLSLEIAQQALAKLATVTRVVTLTWQNRTFQTAHRVLLLFTPSGTWRGEEENGETIIWLRPLSQDGLASLLAFDYSCATT